MRCLTFKMNGVEYAADVGFVDSVVENRALTAIPSPLDYLGGVMDLRGKAVPVIDLRKKLNLREAASPGSALMIIVFSLEREGSAPTVVGAIVDEVSEVITIPDDGLEARDGGLSELWEKFVTGIARIDGRLVVVMDVAAMFSKSELEAFKAA